MTNGVRPRASQPVVAVALVVVALVGLGFLGCQALKGPTVPGDVVRSVRGDGIRVLDTEEASNPTSEWTDTYLLVEVDGVEPIARVESALTANGWKVLLDEPGRYSVLSAERREAGLTMVTFADFRGHALDRPKVLKAFDRSAAGKEGLFVVSLMPYY